MDLGNLALHLARKLRVNPRERPGGLRPLAAAGMDNHGRTPLVMSTLLGHRDRRLQLVRSEERVTGRSRPHYDTVIRSHLHSHCCNPQRERVWLCPSRIMKLYRPSDSCTKRSERVYPPNPLPRKFVSLLPRLLVASAQHPTRHDGQTCYVSHRQFQKSVRVW